MRFPRIEDYAHPERVGKLKRLLLLRSIATWTLLVISLVLALCAYRLNQETGRMLETIEKFEKIHLSTPV